MLTSEVRGILKSKSAVSPIPTSSPSPENEPKLITTLLKPENSNGFNDSSSEDEGLSSESSETSSNDNKKQESGSEKENTQQIDVKNKKNVVISGIKISEINYEVDEKFTVDKKVNINEVDVINKRNLDVSVLSEVKVRRHLEEVQQISSSGEGTPQTSDGESSGGKEVKRIISNEAVARRRQAAINRQKEK